MKPLLSDLPEISIVLVCILFICKSQKQQNILRVCFHLDKTPEPQNKFALLYCYMQLQIWYTRTKYKLVSDNIFALNVDLN